MQTWFDLMRQAQGNAGFDGMMRQFNVSSAQTQRAMVALMPAFALGLQHALANSGDPSRLFPGIADSPFADMWKSTARAFTPQAAEVGKRILDQLFGSDEAARQVAQQAATVTGVGVEVMQQILPLMAGIFAGSVCHWMTHSEHMGAMPARKAPEPEPNPMQAWMDFWTSSLQGKSTGKQKPPTTPLEAVMAPFMGGSLGTPKAQPTQPADLWGEMLGAGAEMQKQYFASLQSIMENVWSPQKKTR
ncbi:DUF937 domain-containing protein [Microvirga flavescens]|uniref:DUF937 domain-containing protein n=1 Tax=Microvirga flavescens TaxID=2249811 RepID=UPI000DDC0978|nr:DUF937 domain-containing protein [Microvirga flavescens]